MTTQVKIYASVLLGSFIAAIIVMTIFNIKEDMRYMALCEKFGGVPYVGDNIRICARPGAVLEVK